MSKRVIREAHGRMRPRLLDSHHWGVALPVAAEALVHWRSAVEAMARRGDISAVVAFDLDLQNMFGSIEWPKIRAAIAAHLPEAAAWTDWAHRESAVVQLPDGTEYRVNRGAEQGDPFGSAGASLTLGDAMDVARPAFEEATAAERVSGQTGAVDEWFIDDGQAFVQPALADAWLRAVDGALAQSGAAPGVGDSCKSVARLVCPDSDSH